MLESYGVRSPLRSNLQDEVRFCHFLCEQRLIRHFFPTATSVNYCPISVKPYFSYSAFENNLGA